MSRDYLNELSQAWLRELCVNIPERCVGSEGNRQATGFFEAEVRQQGWQTEMPCFAATDWNDGGATLSCGENEFKALVSPYSTGFTGEAVLVQATTAGELEALNTAGKIILLRGDIAKEQLMPKNFVFYNPDEHRRIISLLERSMAKALVCATGRNAALAGGVYPFPLIEDGDFDIPSVYMTEEEGERLAEHTGSRVNLQSVSERVPGKGYNVICRRGAPGSRRIVITAHIDAKKGTPGAIDNATGVVVLLLLAELLKDYVGDKQIELIAFNGEDYYAVPGQMNYVMANQGNFGNILLNINIDGAGYRNGLSSFSLFELPEELLRKTNEVLLKYEGITEGIQWPQGDHSIFLMNGVPAIAVSSKWFIDNISTQEITHTPKDNISIVDCDKLVEISLALNDLIRSV
jgi:aminopeptidase YwaD